MEFRDKGGLAPAGRSLKALALMALAALSLGAGAAQAADFKSVGAAPAVFYDAPSERGRRVYVAPRGMPVEVVLTYNDWSKVRDAGGDLSWVESSALSPARNVVVNIVKAQIRAAANDASPLLFTADKGVLLEMVEPPKSDWIKIRHRDGQSGYVKAAEVWGD
jgi:SH3-like domain-containing protein